MTAARGAPIALGFRAGRGGSVVVAVTALGPAPRVVLSRFLATAADGDRLAREPFHVAVEIAGGAGQRLRQIPDAVAAAMAEAEAAVVEGRRRQDALATEGLAAILGELREAAFDPRVAALLINRAGWLTPELRLRHSLSAPEHPPVIEGLAVRDALRFAFARCGLDVVEMDEKSLLEVAAARLELSPSLVDGLGASVGRPWRKEHKLACLAAWVAVAGL